MSLTCRSNIKDIARLYVPPSKNNLLRNNFSDGFKKDVFALNLLSNRRVGSFFGRYDEIDFSTSSKTNLRDRLPSPW
jgi:hypothetical protein